MITYYFDISSPWTWLAFRRLQRLAVELDTTVDWKPNTAPPCETIFAPL